MLRLYIILVLACMVYEAYCNRVHERIYYDVPDIVQCYRRLNRTHQIGCASKQEGNVGVLHYISSQEDLEWFVEQGPHKPYIVLLPLHQFTQSVIDGLRQSGKVNGVIVQYDETDDAEDITFSPDNKCPSTNYELYKDDPEYANCKQKTWNPDGIGLLMSDVEFPILQAFVSNQTDFLLHKCFEEFNKPINGTSRSYPLCGAEIKAGMDAVKDTPTCINRGKTRNMSPQTFCDPMGDSNVYGFLQPIPYNSSNPQYLPDKSLIIATAKLDGTGIFEDRVPATQTTVASFVTLLAAAEALGKIKDKINLNSSKPIMFAFFQGESFDYMGSIRMLYDMQNGDFPYSLTPNSLGIHPISPQHIGDFLEVSQIAAPLNGEIFMHSDPRSPADVKNLLKKVEDVLSGYGKLANYSIKPSGNNIPLPPASLHTFLKEIQIPGIVLTDHDGEYRNRYYNGFLDKPSHLNYSQTRNDSQSAETALSEHITKMATVLAQTLYNMSTGNAAPDELSANGSLVAQMLYCFMVSPQCELFNESVGDGKGLKPTPYSFYVGISRNQNEVTLLTHFLLARFTGDIVNLNKSSCKDYDDKDDKRLNPRSPYYRYIWMQGPVNASSETDERIGLCIQTTANKSSGLSPAFLESQVLSTTEYPAWSESIWSDGIPHLRVFLIPDPHYEVQILCIGIAVFAASLLAVFFINKRATLLFKLD